MKMGRWFAGWVETRNRYGVGADMATPIFAPKPVGWRSERPAQCGVSGTAADQVSRKGLGFGANEQGVAVPLPRDQINVIRRDQGFVPAGRKSWYRLLPPLGLRTFLYGQIGIGAPLGPGAIVNPHPFMSQKFQGQHPTGRRVS